MAMRSEHDTRPGLLVLLVAAILAAAVGLAGCELLGSGCANGICSADTVCDGGLDDAGGCANPVPLSGSSDAG